MARVTLEQWRMLQAVINHGGFAQAAAAIHKSQSSINHAIHKMEDLLGVKVLEVRGRKAHLTEEGALLLRRAQTLLDNADNIERLADSLGSGQEAEIVLAVDQSFPTDYLAEALAAFSIDYPNTRIQLHETVLSGAGEFLSDGTADVAVTAQPITHYLGEPLFTIDFIAAAHPHHPLQHLGRLVRADDLAQHRQLVVRDSSQKGSTDAGWLGAESRWTVSNLPTSVEIILQGFGFAWLPYTQIKGLLEEARLVPLPLESGGRRKMTLQLYHADRDRAGPATERLVTLLKDICVKDRKCYASEQR